MWERERERERVGVVTLVHSLAIWEDKDETPFKHSYARIWTQVLVLSGHPFYQLGYGCVRMYMCEQVSKYVCVCVCVCVCVRVCVCVSHASAIHPPVDQTAPPKSNYNKRIRDISCLGALRMTRTQWSSANLSRKYSDLPAAALSVAYLLDDNPVSLLSWFEDGYFYISQLNLTVSNS